MNRMLAAERVGALPTKTVAGSVRSAASRAGYLAVESSRCGLLFFLGPCVGGYLAVLAPTRRTISAVDGAFSGLKLFDSIHYAGQIVQKTCLQRLVIGIRKFSLVIFKLQVFEVLIEDLPAGFHFPEFRILKRRGRDVPIAYQKCEPDGSDRKQRANDYAQWQNASPSDRPSCPALVGNLLLVYKE